MCSINVLFLFFEPSKKKPTSLTQQGLRPTIKLYPLPADVLSTHSSRLERTVADWNGLPRRQYCQHGPSTHLSLVCNWPTAQETLLSLPPPPPLPALAQPTKCSRIFNIL